MHYHKPVKWKLGRHCYYYCTVVLIKVATIAAAACIAHQLKTVDITVQKG